MLVHPIHPTRFLEETTYMHPAAALIPATGLGLLLAGSVQHDVGLQIFGGVSTAITAAGLVWFARQVTKAIDRRNAEVTEQLVGKLADRLLVELRAELHGHAQDIDQLRGEVAATNRRVDGLYHGN